jgi:hypothetical protein
MMLHCSGNNNTENICTCSETYKFPFLGGGSIGIWTQGLLDRWTTTWTIPPARFCFSHFFNRVSLLCPDRPGLWSSYLCFRHSWYDRHAPTHFFFQLIDWLTDWDGGLTICPGWPQTMNLLIFTSHVARITVVSHSAWLFPKGFWSRVGWICRYRTHGYEGWLYTAQTIWTKSGFSCILSTLYKLYQILLIFQMKMTRLITYHSPVSFWDMLDNKIHRDDHEDHKT